MKILRNQVAPFDFEGLEIRDYTSNQRVSSSLAEIIVPPGIKHRKAHSRRSDKYYYIVEGTLNFLIDNESCVLCAGDVCIIPQDVTFYYENASNNTAKLILIHTPDFVLEEEVFDE